MDTSVMKLDPEKMWFLVKFDNVFAAVPFNYVESYKELWAERGISQIMGQRRLVFDGTDAVHLPYGEETCQKILPENLHREATVLRGPIDTLQNTIRLFHKHSFKASQQVKQENRPNTIDRSTSPIDFFNDSEGKSMGLSAEEEYDSDETMDLDMSNDDTFQCGQVFDEY